jgi:hypothetical protein
MAHETLSVLMNKSNMTGARKKATAYIHVEGAI